ncbi:hypothetical protein F7018_12605 [Tenacibaculum aiptasiae]|uniref:Uncharacterized protein n=1 Tax=Tenacibaculum aiptasiae TaxID=426481 RepID=A0A7J5ACW6_9FLAO|nr:hypothetical protein [Tenacibaculum aiptasiae]KAB1155308.1 hypothetical protein F7018_12605 [Tenacibaculum aiptasiae]
MRHDFCKYANIAHRILNEKTQYKSNKQLISSLFKNTLSNNKLEQVKYRLTIIDSYYSTQMNKRLYGIEQIAEAISSFTDEELRNEITPFLNAPKTDTKLFKLLYSSYGINKEGNSSGKATSLLSKYIYFLNHYNFPIYDNLASESYPLLTGKRMKQNNYFENIIQLNEATNICDFEKLDNLLWLLGKLKKGSFSILMDIDKYQKITSIEKIQSQFNSIKNGNSKNKSRLKDNVIRDYIAQNYNDVDFFNSDEISFFDFVFNLK